MSTEYCLFRGPSADTTTLAEALSNERDINLAHSTH